MATGELKKEESASQRRRDRRKTMKTTHEAQIGQVFQSIPY
jgi:hypothetical protein